MIAPPTLAVHAVVARSRANGPGERMVIWVQGCSLGCPGCFNPDTHAPSAGHRVTVPELAARVIAASSRIDGLTVSGGEPFEQPHALAALLAGISMRAALSVLVFTGFTLREIRRNPARARALEHVDVLIAGRYARKRRQGHAMHGSSNQRIHLLSPRHTLAELEATPELEVHVALDGTLLMTGIGPGDLDPVARTGGRDAPAGGPVATRGLAPRREAGGRAS